MSILRKLVMMGVLVGAFVFAGCEDKDDPVVEETTATAPTTSSSGPAPTYSTPITTAPVVVDADKDDGGQPTPPPPRPNPEPDPARETFEVANNSDFAVDTYVDGELRTLAPGQVGSWDVTGRSDVTVTFDTQLGYNTTVVGLPVDGSNTYSLGNSNDGVGGSDTTKDKKK